MAMGGKREGAGRKLGSLNKITREVKEMAREHGPAAIKHLVHVMKNGSSEQAQVTAAREILDRAYGKPTQYHDVTRRTDLTDLTDAELAAIASGRSLGAAEETQGAIESDQLH